MPPILSFVLGTRPEIIKMSPVIRACQDQNVPFSIIHTGQHYSEELDAVFFKQLDLPTPEHNLSVGSDSHGRQTGEMLGAIESVLEAESPETVLVQGDTNSVLAGAVAASKMDDIDVGHIEAGLRSFDRDMPEEINRRVADHTSDYLFAPTETAREHLRSEGVPDDQITMTGNTVVDAVQQHVDIAHKRNEIDDDIRTDGQFALLTAHRAENVDDRARFQSLLNGVASAAREHSLSVVYPIHPRASKRLKEYDISLPAEIRLVEPQDFLDFLLLEDDATIVFTDSGGVQEESCILETPCVTLRDSTERPETVDVGANRVVGVSPSDIVSGATEMLGVKPTWANPFGDGTAADQILDTLGYGEVS
ncbi:UDP-N-acetylglucosamine 2-epimerase (non-hydrolyzing) [Haloarcula sp. CBA1130]|uniref:non-hydrolyzing UDP-N-acetylglucosamine 2-epimerase n=1 Tax=unclassified Haloarcula TaxID=2624677 RepID=UPI0012488FCA|nr:MULTISPECIES: UDP-N-acetylglucosamine 2-epimerase (non-hydrolyzing) [unclassified Haloarcula]KAA9398345.1 UDP-N-acetylglucosamine 2-epimerase (non-hydrolyzing) [Haloarcula sp. CBA1129]KAA9402060.1 UDP-N-acetylglucosamine 2-epimerase (non-hydrolyzing) [Haloarcula sp. CBA1130]